MKRNNLEFYDTWATEWWDKNAKVYALNYLNQPRFEYFDRYIPAWERLEVLDVGCGGGFTCEFLASRGAAVTGIDQSAACITAAKEHAEKRNYAIDYHYAYSEALPFTDQTFDVVTCVDVLEHVANLSQTLNEIHRVLKPNGILCFDTINRTLRSKLIMIWLLENLLNEIPRGIHDWNKFIQPQELTDALHHLNFHTIEIAGFNIFGTTLKDYVANYLHYRKMKSFRISLHADTSVMYIGKAVKSTK